MNDQNLIPNSQRSREELQAMGRKGGIRSGEVRRHNRELEKMAKWILEDDMKAIAESFKVIGLHAGGSEYDK